ncbi:MAG: hypothetical protein FJ221_11380 [Lentisphaerae bacterium]|nr:hypothetical protein [Lentisphaerota bacterium]
MKTWTWMAVVVAAAVVLVPADAPAAPKKGKKDAKKEAPAAPKNKVDAAAKSANRMTIVGTVKVTKDDKGFIKAVIKADDGTVYPILNPAIVEDKDGQKAKVIVGSEKVDAKTKAKSIQVDEVQAAR